MEATKQQDFTAASSLRAMLGATIDSNGAPSSVFSVTMTKRQGWALGVGLVLAALVSVVLLSPRIEFVVGGALVNLGYRLQDRFGAFDFVHDESVTPEQIWDELVRQNELSARVRDLFPRTVRHPVVAILACMDARIDTSELVGDTRRYYYIVRTAGSVLSPAEQEMLELAVLNGVQVIVLTTHTDCAAEAAAANPEMRKKFPALVSLLDERERRIDEFMARPTIRDAIAAGKLEIKRARIDTDTDRLVVTR
jgi:Carbonic anhydrase